MKCSNTIRTAALSFALGLFAGPAAADVTLSFFAITSNSVASAGTAGQYSVDVAAAGSGVSFTFNNAGPAASSITEVYFDDGTLLGISALLNGPGVNFTAGAASPGNLPSGNTVSPPFQVTAGFLADANPPGPTNGINPGEWLRITFALIGGQTLADTEAALASGALRIGIHVTAFANGQSESFVNNPPRRVPEPASLMLLGLGLAGLALLRRRNV